MTDGIKLDSSSPLCFLPPTAKEKLVLTGRDFVWMKPEDIKKDNSHVTDSLRDISKKLESAEIFVDKEEDLENLLINLTLLDREIKQHNSSIENNCFLRFIDVVLNFVSAGTFRLKYHPLSEKVHNSEEVCKQSLIDHPEYRASILEKYSRTPELLGDLPELGAAIVKSLENNPLLTPKEVVHLQKIYLNLPENSRSSLLPYFDDIDFLFKEAKEPSLISDEYRERRLTSSSIAEFKANATPEEMEKSFNTLACLIAFTDGTIEDEIMADPLLNERFLNYYKEMPPAKKQNLPTRVLLFFNGEQRLFERKKAGALFREVVEKQNPQELKSFFETTTLIDSGLLGTKSGKNEKVIKFKAKPYGIPHDISYNRENGDIIVNYGVIGKGAFKVVKKKMSLLSGQMVAVGKQSLREADPVTKRFAKREIEMMKKLKGAPNVLNLHSVSFNNSRTKGEEVVTMTEFCDMGELKDHMKTLSEKQKLQVTMGIIRGVLEAHKQGIIHRDLKPTNIFLKKEIRENGEAGVEAVVADFGLACWAEGDPDRNLNAGSKPYMEPYLLEGNFQVSFASDAWSIGLILNGLFINDDVSQIKTMPDLKNFWQQLEIRPEPSNKESIEYVIWKLLRKEVGERMSLDETLAIVERLST